MVPCTNCGWVTARELTWHGLCLTCREYRWQNGRDRPPPTTRPTSTAARRGPPRATRACGTSSPTPGSGSAPLARPQHVERGHLAGAGLVQRVVRVLRPRMRRRGGAGLHPKEPGPGEGRLERPRLPEPQPLGQVGDDEPGLAARREVVAEPGQEARRGTGRPGRRRRARAGCGRRPGPRAGCRGRGRRAPPGRGRPPAPRPGRRGRAARRSPARRPRREVRLSVATTVAPRRAARKARTPVPVPTSKTSFPARSRLPARPRPGRRTRPAPERRRRGAGARARRGRPPARRASATRGLRPRPGSPAAGAAAALRGRPQRPFEGVGDVRRPGEGNAPSGGHRDQEAIQEEVGLATPVALAAEGLGGRSALASGAGSAVVPARRAAAGRCGSRPRRAAPRRRGCGAARRRRWSGRRRAPASGAAGRGGEPAGGRRERSRGQGDHR